MIIINADDFGRSHDVNSGIIKAFSDGLINHTTLMVNMPAVEEALEKAKVVGITNKIGLHLNLTEGKPLYTSFDKRMLDCNGFFLKEQFYLRKSLHRFFLPRNVKKSIYKEFDLQIQKYLSFGFSDMHIDSHNHIHTDRAVFSVLKKLLKKYRTRISYIRPSKNMYVGKVPLLKFVYKNMFNNYLLKFLKRKTQNYFGTYTDYCARQKNDNCDYELMCHPVIINEHFFDLYDSSYLIQDLKRI